LASFIRERLAAGATIYPPRPFRALELTPLHSVRAVILGQDPYHGPGQAEGLAFSVRAGVKLPPSLRNIFKELGCAADEQPPTGSLADWARRGVLLLNASLTVEDGQPGSHAKKGWEVLIDALLTEAAARTSPCRCGRPCQAKPLVEETAMRHGREALVLQAITLHRCRPPSGAVPGCGRLEA
jgi:uracil-DNA glycosylase